MEKKIRSKFVLLTMILMVSVFGVIYIIESIYTCYWDELDKVSILEILADCHAFEPQLNGEEIIPTYEGGIICYVRMGKDGTIQYKADSTGRKQFLVPRSLLKKIEEDSSHQFKWKRYIYIIREYENGDVGIYYTDRFDHPLRIKKVIEAILIVFMGLILLFLVSMYLSKFVVKPAQAALEREKQFIADASHELKTPITAICVNAEALKSESNQNKHLQFIISEAKRMDRLIHKLLTLSALEEKKMYLEKRCFSLSDCFEEIVLSMESIAYEKKISYQYEIEENVMYIGNEDEIEQVAIILLDNAIKHTPELGEVSFTLSVEKKKIVIKVMNTGVGISPEDLPHVFERFYCSEKSRNKEKHGFGLGLAIAKAIVEAHDGTISVVSQYGSKVCFCIKL